MVFYEELELLGDIVALILKSGDNFSGCEIIGQCGKGAAGVTYLARNPLGQKIVIKIVTSPKSLESELRGLRHYMQIANTNSNLLHVYHVGETDEGFYYTMEAADDCSATSEYKPATLANLLKRYKCFTPEEAIVIIRELLEGLKVIHDAGLIHRDIKPDNIIFVNGKAKLSDPGLVIKVGETVSLAGTLGFISPEVINGDREFDRQCDLYALGKVFYCMVTGFHPKQYPMLPDDMRIAVCRQIYPALLKMCNRNPERRFRDADDFLQGLPVKLENPTRWESLRQDFFDWKQCNRELFRAVTIALSGGILLLIAGVAAWGVWQKQQTELNLMWKKTADDFLAINKERKELTAFQLQVFHPELLPGYLKLKSELENSYARQDWKKCATQTKELARYLQKAAAAAMPALPDKGEKNPAAWQSSGAGHGFMVSPLAAYADPALLAQFRKRLSRLDRALYKEWSGPRCDREWQNFQYSDYPMVFVPPGAVRMDHTKEVVKIPYHFWICKHEVLHNKFAQFMTIAPQYSKLDSSPVERVCWNDMLFFCHTVTEDFRQYGVLPPGYIVRPPTEAEWEYAAKNAWLGPDTTPFAERARFRVNSQKRSWAPGSRQASRLGLWDMYGNVAEVTVPHSDPGLLNAHVARGGSFLSKTEAACYGRVPQLSSQFIPYDVGFRLVVAPGDMDFFDKHFYLSGPRQTRYRGKVYELVGGLSAAFTWEQADKFSRLLGGRLAEFETEDARDHVMNTLRLATSWPAFAGACPQGGKWIWQHSKKELTYGTWHSSAVRKTKNAKGVALQGKYLIPAGDVKLPVFFCEWDEKDYEKRNDLLKKGGKMPFELTRFNYGTKEYILIGSSIYWDGANRACELLEGRLAVLDSPELRQLALRELAPFAERRILLGGYAKRNKWMWLNGKEADFPVQNDHVVNVPSRNRNFITFTKGGFYNSQWSQAFLLERERSSVSSH